MPYEIASTIDEYQSLPEKVYNEVIWLTNASKKTTLHILQGMLEKQLFWKFWKIIRKTFLVVFKIADRVSVVESTFISAFSHYVEKPNTRIVCF